MLNTLRQNVPLILVLLLGIACGRGWGQDEREGPQPQAADQQNPADESRYLLGSCGSQFGNAAYILDTTNGDLFYVLNSGRLRKIGSVAE